MSTRVLAWNSIFVAIILACICASLMPAVASATQEDADSICLPKADPDRCICGPSFMCDKSGCGCKGPPTKYMCPCSDMTNGGVTSGHCTATFHCHGETFSGTAGQSGGQVGMQQLMQAIQGIMSAIQSGASGGSGSGSDAGYSSLPGSTGCTSYYQVSTPSSDPCAYYIAPVSSYLGSTTGGTTAGDLLESLSGYQSTPSVSEQLLNAFGPESSQITSSNTTVSTSTSAPEQNTPSANVNNLNSIGTMPGVQGNINIGSNGATIFVNSRDEEKNTEVAGFYGSDTFGTNQPQGIVASMCRSRPWATNILSAVIPPTFFDSLCTWRGYQVGAPPTPSVTVQQTTLPKPAANKPAAPAVQTPATSSAPLPPPQVDIWASPTSVPLGARTSIFWSSTNVQSCLVTSPDGNFHETAFSGGASTVPLSGATTFTISCASADGQHATKDITVRMAI